MCLIYLARAHTGGEFEKEINTSISREKFGEDGGGLINVMQQEIAPTDTVSGSLRHGLGLLFNSYWTSRRARWIMGKCWG